MSKLVQKNQCIIVKVLYLRKLDVRPRVEWLKYCDKDNKDEKTGSKESMYNSKGISSQKSRYKTSIVEP